MRTDSGDFLKLGIAVAASVTAVTAARYLWQRFSNGPKPQPNGHKADALSSRSPGRSGASPKKGGPDPEEGIWIYFGSQSGTAEGFAKEIEEEASGQEMSATVVDMEDFDPDEFVRHKVVILVVATYGEGDPPDNAVQFYKWLQDTSLSEDTMQSAKFTVMGLGNRQYVHFNAAAKVADQHLERLGATRIYERGEGDDDQNIEEDFEQWKGNGLWPALRTAMGLVANGQAENGTTSVGVETAEQVLSRLPLGIEIAESTKSLPVDPMVQVGGADILGKWYFNASLAPVSVCDELRQVADPNSGKTTKHIEFSAKQLPALDWRTADNLEVLAQNTEENVMWFARRFGMEDKLDSFLTFIRAPNIEKSVKKPFPAPCTVRTALEIYCDLHSAPTYNAAKKLASLVENPGQRGFLTGLLGDREAYHWLAGKDARLSLREFFELFLASAEIPFAAFLQLCPRQKSRPYTIASSAREDKSRIGICVSMVKEELMSIREVLEGLESRGHPLPSSADALEKLGSSASSPRRFDGLCSTFLCTRVNRGQKLWIFARPSSFRLPRRTTTPIVMIGAGTGVAPFRAFLREFRAENGARSRTILFFGCTKKDEDFVYRDEIEEALALKPPPLAELVTAFSREQAHKVYVQHRLKERSQEIAKLVKEGSYIYVCGAVAMGKAVREELVQALGSTDYVDRLQTEGRFVEELW